MAQETTDLRKTSLTYTLKRCQLFTGLPQKDLDEIVDCTIVKSLDKGSFLFHEGENSTGFYIVQKGAICVHRVNAQGKEQVIHIFRDGESFAEGSLATPKGYPADARAVEPSQVLLIQKTGFLELLHKRPDLSLRMLASMSMHLHILVDQIEDLTLKDVETRLSQWLVERCPEPKSEVPFTVELGISKTVLASELGTVSETLSRTMARLRAKGFLEVKEKSVSVLSPAKLSGLLHTAGAN
jgi:CRP-like cAMP-binding protein